MMRGGTRLVVIAGDAGVKYEAREAQLAADLVGIARPVTKWAARVTDPGSVLRMFRRAVKIASTPPYGPTFLALPADILAAADNPLIVMGDGVSDSGAAFALGSLANRIGAEIWGANSSQVNVAF